jgi:hypothetical protein
MYKIHSANFTKFAEFFCEKIPLDNSPKVWYNLAGRAQAPRPEILSIGKPHNFFTHFLCNIPVLQFSRNHAIISITKEQRTQVKENDYEKHI